jgi:hypothetical protein
MPRFIAKVSGAYFPLKTLENKIAALRTKVQKTPVRHNVSVEA